MRRRASVVAGEERAGREASEEPKATIKHGFQVGGLIPGPPMLLPTLGEALCLAGPTPVPHTAGAG